MLITDEVAAGGHHDVPEPRAYGGRRPGRTSRGRRASSRVSTSARSPSTLRQVATHVVDGARRGSTRAGTGPRRRAAATPSSSSGWSSTSSRRCGGRVDHAVVGHDHDPDVGAAAPRAAARRRRRPSPAGARHDVERDAVAVAGPVEVALVHVGQRRARVPTPRRTAAIRSPTLVGADELRAALAGDGEPGAGELALVDHRRVPRPALAEPLERGRVRLPLARVDVLAPQQRVEQLVGAGDPRGEADHAVGAGRQRGAQRGQAGRGGRRARRRSRARCPSSSECRNGACVGVVAQQLVAEAVDEEHDVGAGLAAARATVGGSPASTPRARATAGSTSPSERSS